MNVTNRAASVVAKLLNLQKMTGRSHQYLIDRFAQERFLYRISTGVHRERFVLKGGLLLTAVSGQFYRATRDIDARVFAENNPDVIRALIVEGTSHEVHYDGMTFDLAGMTVNEIIAQRGEEHGLRLSIRALLGERVRAQVQLDMAFTDQILLPHDAFEYPVLLPEYPAPIIRAYSVESAIAEKLEAIASLDTLTSRYKDYDDILAYGAARKLHVAPLSHAVTVTFETRGTSIDRLAPALGSDRATVERERAYQQYRRRDAVTGEPTSFAAQLERLRAFVHPLLRYAEDGIARIWDKGTWITI
jgi:predicted nucleotidyltransferase component of viral defense system